MAIKYYQNKKTYDILVPSTGGNTVVVKPSKFVIDNLGTYYSTMTGLTEVTQGDVVVADTVYTYDPIDYAEVSNTTGKIDPLVENDAAAAEVLPDQTNANGQYLKSVTGVATWASVTPGTVPGTDTQVIFNDGGSALGADAGITYNKTTDKLTVTGGIIDSALTSGRLVFAKTSGELGDNAVTMCDPTTGVVTLGPPATDVSMLTVRASADPGTANILQWQTSANGALGHIAHDGGISAPSVQLTTGARPTADAAHRGMIWYVAGGAGVADTIEICVKSAGDTYSWVSLV